MIIKKTCNFDCELKDGKLKITLHGEIDHHSEVTVRSAIDAKLYELRPHKAVMDLSGIEFMDSSGLGLIMGRYALMQKLGGEFSIANPTERVQKIFELAGLGRIISIEKPDSDVDDEEEKANNKKYEKEVEDKQ